MHFYVDKSKDGLPAINFCVQRVVPSLNKWQRMGWRKRHKEGKLWKQEMIFLAQTLKSDQRFTLPLRQPRIFITRVVPNKSWLLDPDNILVKPILDAMVHRGIIIDDSPEHIDLVRTQESGGGIASDLYTYIRIMTQHEPSDRIDSAL